MAGDNFRDGLPLQTRIFQHRVDFVGIDLEALVAWNLFAQVADHEFRKRGVLRF